MVIDVEMITNWLLCIQIQMFEAEDDFDQLCFHSTTGTVVQRLSKIEWELTFWFFHSTHCFLWVNLFYKAILLLMLFAPDPVSIMSGTHSKAQLSSFFVALSMNESLTLRILQLYIRNAITPSPFPFKTLISQVNKQTGSNIEACDIWLVTHF